MDTGGAGKHFIRPGKIQHFNVIKKINSDVNRQSGSIDSVYKVIVFLNTTAPAEDRVSLLRFVYPFKDIFQFVLKLMFT